MKTQDGFTFVELIVVMGMVATLMAFATVNLLNLQRHTHLQTSISTMVADIYEQRQRAMTGDTQGRAIIDSYGVYFQTNQYTLFHGSVYSAVSPDNVVIPLQNPVQMSATTFANATLLFTKGSGEVSSFSNGQNTVTFSNSSSNEQLTLVFNKYGTITSNLP